MRHVVTLALAVFLSLQLPVVAQVRAQPPAALGTILISGRGRAEGFGPNSRFQGRFVIWSVEGAEESVFGKDVSLFSPPCVAQFGRGVQCAHLIAVLNGVFLEAFDTSSPPPTGDNFTGHMAGRTSATERLRVFFDPAPNGSRNFENLATFEVGQPVAVYKVREFVTADIPAGFFISRNDLEILESRPFTFNGVTVDFKNIAPRLTGIWHGRPPVPDPDPDPIPDEPPFKDPAFVFTGPGVFALRFPVSGFLLAVQPR